MIGLIIASGFTIYTLYNPVTKIQAAITNGFNFLNGSLWDHSVGGYKETPDPTQLGDLALAYYYTWYDDPGHTPPWAWPNSSIYEPSLGSYNSSDSAVISQHLSWIKQAGLNGVLVS